MNVYIVLAMARSGHHAIINWIGQQHNNLLFLNDTRKGWDEQRFDYSVDMRLHRLFGDDTDDIDEERSLDNIFDQGKSI